MPAPTIPEDVYLKLIDAYREKPGNARHATRKVGVAPQTARKMWRFGHARKGWLPIEEVIRREQLEARAGLHDAEVAKYREHAERDADSRYLAQEKAREDAVKSRRQEAELVRAQRGNLTALVGVTGRMLRGALRRAEDLELLVAIGKDKDGNPLDVREQVYLVKQVGGLMRETSSASTDVIKMERLLLGEPTEILGLHDTDGLSEDEAIRGIREAAEAARRFEARRGNLRVVEGGKKDD